MPQWNRREIFAFGFMRLIGDPLRSRNQVGGRPAGQGIAGRIGCMIGSRGGGTLTSHQPTSKDEPARSMFPLLFFSRVGFLSSPG